jgi:hypothetical protein
MSLIRNPHDFHPVEFQMCLVLTDDDEVTLRPAYFAGEKWRDPYTARQLVPMVIGFCPMAEAMAVICGAANNVKISGLKGGGK